MKASITGVLYSGGQFRQWWTDLPVVTDLAGMALPTEALPILVDHTNHPSTRIGTGAARIERGQLLVDAELYASDDDPADAEARRIIGQAQAGYDWPLSHGGFPASIEEVRAGEEVFVNERSFVGPLLVVRKSELKEGSIVAVPADGDSISRIAASYSVPASIKATLSNGGDMDPNKDKTTDQVAADASKADATTTEPQVKAEEPKTVEEPKAEPSVQAAAPTNQTTPQAPAVNTNPAPTRDIAATFDEIDVVAADWPDLAKQAKKDAAKDGNWNMDNLHREVSAAYRKDRPNPTTTGRVATVNDHRILEAAAIQAFRPKVAEKAYDEQTLQAAHTQYRGRMGLQELIIAAAQLNGYTGPLSFKTYGSDILRAAFSTMDAVNIFSNTANKALLSGFNGVEDSWRAIASTRSVPDFKQVSSYRMSSDMTFLEVAPDGELQHGRIGETAYTNQADTYGRLFAITRKDMINDDLGALTEVPMMLGRGAALALNDVIWAEFMDNSAFFTALRGNYQSGAATALSIASLTAAELLFLDQTDPRSKPLGVDPAILLVPNALFVTATNLMASLEVRKDGSSSADTYMVQNPHAGKFQVVKSSYLGNSSITGYSTLAWYLLADPMDMPTIEVAFLNGQQTPVVESADADFASLGMRFRGYFDFGTNKQEYRGGVKSKGEA